MSSSQREKTMEHKVTQLLVLLLFCIIVVLPVAADGDGPTVKIFEKKVITDFNYHEDNLENVDPSLSTISNQGNTLSYTTIADYKADEYGDFHGSDAHITGAIGLDNIILDIGSYDMSEISQVPIVVTVDATYQMEVDESVTDPDYTAIAFSRLYLFIETDSHFQCWEVGPCPSYSSVSSFIDQFGGSDSNGAEYGVGTKSVGFKKTFKKSTINHHYLSPTKEDFPTKIYFMVDHDVRNDDNPVPQLFIP